MASDQEMREWARANGYSVGERGRLPERVINAYQWANRTNGETVTVTTAEPVITSRYCQECWEALPDHISSCSLAAPIPVAATVAPEADEKVERHPDFVHVTPGPSDIERAIADLVSRVAPATSAPMDVDQVRKIAEEVALEIVAEVATPKIVHVHVKDREPVVFEEKTHAEFENVLKLLARKRNVYLYGPPGTGKSTIALQAAKALGVPYGDISCEPTMAASKMFGFIDANGVCRSVLFKDIFTGGGVWNWEEIDNGHPGIVAAMNTALANGHCAFPDGVYQKSPDFYAVATANTHGTSATRQFVGRNQLDAATLDRFVEWEIGIDEEIEELGVLAEIADKAKGREWLGKVREWRKAAADANLGVIISPRGAMNGAVMLDDGFSWEQAAKACIFKGMDAATRAKIERGY